MDPNLKTAGLAPFSLKDAPAMIERVFPAQKIGIEAQKERNSNATQTLTALGSYWKGRKPLVLVRACILASLLPATEDPDADLAVLDALMCMDESGLLRRHPAVTASIVQASTAISPEEKALHVQPAEAKDRDATLVPSRLKKTRAFQWKGPVGLRSRDPAWIAKRLALQRAAFLALSFSEKVDLSERVERIEHLRDEKDPLYADIFKQVNASLGTSASTLPGLIEELGIARFGHPASVGDPFSGGGSIPFEAGRLGCGVVASDLNPVAATLTWGAFRIVGAEDKRRREISSAEARVLANVDAAMTRHKVEHDGLGLRARSFLYCLEVVDPQTGWLVPLCPSWIISKTRRCIATLEADYDTKSFRILVREGASNAELEAAKIGTEQEGFLVYDLAPIEGGSVETWRLSLDRLRGDKEGEAAPDGTRGNCLRRWEKADVAPRRPVWHASGVPMTDGARAGAWKGGDILLERLYCIRWVSESAAGRGDPGDRFAAPNAEDDEREKIVFQMVSENLAAWQESGLVPDMAIERGAKTDEPIRTRGWTHWHHLFNPRQLLLAKEVARAVAAEQPEVRLLLPKAVNVLSRLCRINTNGAGGESLEIKDTFSNQALNTLINYGCRGFLHLASVLRLPSAVPGGIIVQPEIAVRPATDVPGYADLWIFDPPYADAVHYHEITEFFIAWMRRNPPPPFDRWIWDSRRPLAIQGSGDKFRADMVAAFVAMGNHMPDNGLQVCMFTHKDAGVWADMAGIVWASGLRVTAAWYVSTETTSEQKQGGYVQGTVLLVLRKRLADEFGYRSDIIPEVRARVAQQVETLTGMNQRAKGNDRDENLFSDADIQMAGYAAALEILTTYTHIDGVDMTREALRPRSALRRGQPIKVGIVEEMIALAVQTANARMLPDGLAEGLWERLGATERFYLKMTAAEAAWPAGVMGGKLDNYQNFAKAYRAEGWEDLMADRQPNRARLKTATEFRAAYLNGHALSGGSLRPTLYAVMCLHRDAEAEIDAENSGKQALHGLRDHFGDAEWLRERDNVRVLAAWLGRTWGRRNPGEATAARVLAQLVANERL